MDSIGHAARSGAADVSSGRRDASDRTVADTTRDGQTIQPICGVRSLQPQCGAVNGTAHRQHGGSAHQLRLHAKDVARSARLKLVDMRVPQVLRCLWDYYAAFYRTVQSPLLRLPVCGLPPAARGITRDDIDVLLRRGFIRRVLPGEQPRGYVHLFTVREKLDTADPRRRLIAEPEANQYLDIPDAMRFSLPGPASTIAAARDVWMKPTKGTLRQKTFAVCIDLTYFYGQLGLAAELELAHVFNALGDTYCLRTVPTGGRQVVGLAQLVSKTLVANVASHAEVYIDNIRLMSRSRLQLAEDVMAIYSLAATLGIRINEELEHSLTQLNAPLHEFIGFEYDFVRGTVRLRDRTANKLRRQAAMIYDPTASWKEVRSLAGLWGHALALAPAMRSSSYHVLKYLRRRQQCQEEDAAYIWPCIQESWHASCWELSEAIATLVKPHTRNCVTLYTDASLNGWGAVGFYDDGQRVILAGPWNLWERNLAICELELEAVVRSIDALHAKSTFTGIRLRIDNTSAQWAVIKGRSKHYHMNKRIAQLHDLLRRKKFYFIDAVYVESERNHADFFSRLESLMMPQEARCLSEDCPTNVGWVGKNQIQSLFVCGTPHTPT